MVRNKFPIVWKHNLDDLIIWPTPKRFVEHHRYQEESVRRALISFRLDGGGKGMSYLRFLNFENKEIQMCRKTYISSDPSEDHIFET